jgi:hypothetical protein
MADKSKDQFYEHKPNFTQEIGLKSKSTLKNRKIKINLIDSSEKFFDKFPLNEILKQGNTNYDINSSCLKRNTFQDVNQQNLAFKFST